MKTILLIIYLILSAIGGIIKVIFLVKEINNSYKGIKRVCKYFWCPVMMILGAIMWPISLFIEIGEAIERKYRYGKLWFIING